MTLLKAVLGSFLLMLVGSLVTDAALLHTFYSATASASGLVLATDGNFYGTTRYGGNNDLGTVFRLTPTGANQVIYSFTGGNDGANPAAALCLGPDGFLYGTAQYGGTGNAGTVFKISIAGSITSLRSLVGATDGAEPIAGLVIGTNGILYGTASGAGAQGFGTVFGITTNGVTFATLKTFAGTDGDNPGAALVVGTDGLLYGTTQDGGTNNRGTIFKITTGGTFTSLFSFNGTNGAVPQAALVQGADGAFYGTTAYGGTSEFGSIFRIKSIGAFASLYSIIQEDIGSNPSGGVVFGTNGNLYCIANNGGENGFGSIIQVIAFNDFASYYNFTGDNDGGNPSSTLFRRSDGLLFGTTSVSGTNGGGTAFQFATVPQIFFDTEQLIANGLQIRYAGRGGVPNGQYFILSSTNLTTPLTNWNNLATNNFDGIGRFIFTNVPNKLEPKRFFVLRLP